MRIAFDRHDLQDLPQRVLEYLIYLTRRNADAQNDEHGGVVEAHVSTAFAAKSLRLRPGRYLDPYVSFRIPAGRSPGKGIVLAPALCCKVGTAMTRIFSEL